MGAKEYYALVKSRITHAWHGYQQFARQVCGFGCVAHIPIMAPRTGENQGCQKPHPQPHRPNVISLHGPEA